MILSYIYKVILSYKILSNIKLSDTKYYQLSDTKSC